MTSGDTRGVGRIVAGCRLPRVRPGSIIRHNSFDTIQAARFWRAAMRKGLLLIAAILFTSHASFAQETSGVPSTPTAASPMTKLADATPILLRTKEALSSASAKVGDRVPFRVTEDVRAGDLIVSQRGAEAWGIVTAVQRKKRKGEPGSVDVSIQSVQLLSGDRALLRAKRHLEGADKKEHIVLETTQIDSETGGFALPLRPLFYGLALMEKGEDMRLPAGPKVTADFNADFPPHLWPFHPLHPT